MDPMGHGCVHQHLSLLSSSHQLLLKMEVIPKPLENGKPVRKHGDSHSTQVVMETSTENLRRPRSSLLLLSIWSFSSCGIQKVLLDNWDFSSHLFVKRLDSQGEIERFISTCRLLDSTLTLGFMAYIKWIYFWIFMVDISLSMKPF